MPKMPLNTETQEKLDIYLALLQKWQKAVNLVAPSTMEDAWNRHFEDSLAILPLIKDHHTKIADLGSGAGFAGLVLGISRPDLDVHLVESDQKKCSFLKTVSRETGTENVTVHNDRVEDILPSIEPDLVTARAFASLRDILDYMSPLLLNNELEALLHKGRQVDEEIEEARRLYSFDVEKHDNRTSEDSYILHLTHIARG